MSLTNILKLTEIGRKPSRRIIGLMSGTSLDGLDVALCRISGSGTDTAAALLHFETFPYDSSFRQSILEVFAKRQVDLELLTLLQVTVADAHARLVLKALDHWGVAPAEIDCIASHGQTIYHAPQRIHRRAGFPNATLQIGDGDHMAVKTGILTLSDFRQKHLAAGGEGAPLAVYADQLLFSSPDEDRVLLNIGGIANFTWLPAIRSDQQPLSTDTGPGNTLLDAAMRRLFGREFDEDGARAASGTVQDGLLRALLDHPYFDEAWPKTTGPEVFNPGLVAAAKERSGCEAITAEDELATLTRFTAESIARTIVQVSASATIYTSGGGAHNRQLMADLRMLLPGMKFEKFDALGFPGDAKEALLFALLANETLAGNGLPVGDHPRVTLGKISFPLT